MKKIVLVSCGKKKQSRPCPVRELYTSHGFLAARKYAEREGDGGWFILSAKHKLLMPETEIEPYEQTLKQVSRSERRVWSENVFESLSKQFTPGEHGFIILAGNDYCGFLEPKLREAGFQVWRPLKGLRQGEQLSALNCLNERNEDGLDSHT